jgi:hypothetical protein
MSPKLFCSLVGGLVFAFTFPLSGQPQVGITASAPGQVTVSWSATNQWLQSTPLLEAVPFSWMNFTAAQVTTGGVSSVTLAATEAARFFRLVNSSAPPPTRLGVRVDVDGTFMLSWDTVSGATSYKVYMASVAGVNRTNYSGLPDGTVTPGVANNYLAVSGLTAGKRYYFVVTAVSPGESAESNEAADIYGPRGAVNGLVYTLVAAGGNPVSMAVPGVTLTLVNTNDPTINATLQSATDGQFKFPAQPAGGYQLCWSAPGFVSACRVQNIAISNQSVSVGQIAINAVMNATNGMVYGRVLFQNGMPAVAQNNFLQINAAPSVTLTGNSNRVVGVAVVNAQGQYLIGNVPRTNSLKLAAKLENATIATNINSFFTGEANLVFSNSPPDITSLSATLNGNPVFRVAPATSVQVAAYATDPDGDALSFQWFTPYGPVPLVTSSNVSWTLPADPAGGFEYLFVRASDGKGGYADARLTLDVITNLQFSGTVVADDTGLPLTNATVNLNGVTVTTDANGYFSATVDTAFEYYLTIASSGYVLLEKFLDDETTGQEYRLMKISPGICVFDTTVTALVTNAAQVALEIPPGALMDSNGAAYNGNYSVSLDSADPCDAANSFPGGHFTAGSGVLNPYGLVNLSVRDCSGAPLFLKPAVTANLFLPIAAACADTNSTPAFAQFFTLPPNTNRWQVNGLNTQMVIGVRGFIGNIASFGLVAAATPAAPGALLISADRTLHVPFTIGIFKTNGTELIKYVDIFYQTAQDTTNGPNTNVMGQVVAGLPAGPVLVKILDLRQSPGEFYHQGMNVSRANKAIIQIITNTVTGNKTNTVLAGLGVGPGRAVQLKDLTAQTVSKLNFLDVVSPDKTKNLSTKTDDPNAVFNQYYAIVDPGNQKDTFAKWQVANGWPTNNAGVGNFTGSNAGNNDDAFAIYFNATELGAGRRMGMKTNGNQVAYYVATYASLADAEAGANLKYIVCMEYSPHPTLEPTNGYIKFFAYGKNGARTGVVPDEDRHRATYVPYVCMTCHGGGSFSPETTLAATTNRSDVAVLKGDVSGQFIGFDIAGYTFSAVNGYSYANLAAANTFTKLNQGLLKSSRIMPKNKLLKDLVAALIVSNRNYTVAQPAGWETDAASVNLYNQTYAVSCRSCHSTQDTARWPTAAIYKDGGGGAQGGSGNGADPTDSMWGIMPQPQRTYSVFWGSATASKLNTNVFNAPFALGGNTNLFQ